MSNVLKKIMIPIYAILLVSSCYDNRSELCAGSKEVLSKNEKNLKKIINTFNSSSLDSNIVYSLTTTQDSDLFWLKIKKRDSIRNIIKFGGNASHDENLENSILYLIPRDEVASIVFKLNTLYTFELRFYRNDDFVNSKLVYMKDTSLFYNYFPHAAKLDDIGTKLSDKDVVIFFNENWGVSDADSLLFNSTLL